MFYISQLKQDSTIKGQGSEYLEPELDIREDKKCKVEAIRDSADNNKGVESKLPRLFYLVS